MIGSVQDRPEQRSGHIAQGAVGGGFVSAPVVYRGTPSAGNPTNVQTGGENLPSSTAKPGKRVNETLVQARHCDVDIVGTAGRLSRGDLAFINGHRLPHFNRPMPSYSPCGAHDQFDSLLGLDKINELLRGPYQLGVNAVANLSSVDNPVVRRYCMRCLEVLANWQPDGLVLNSEVNHTHDAGDLRNACDFNVVAKGHGMMMNGFSDYFVDSNSAGVLLSRVYGAELSSHFAHSQVGTRPLNMAANQAYVDREGVSRPLSEDIMQHVGAVNDIIPGDRVLLMLVATRHERPGRRRTATVQAGGASKSSLPPGQGGMAAASVGGTQFATKEVDADQGEILYHDSPEEDLDPLDASLYPSGMSYGERRAEQQMWQKLDQQFAAKLARVEHAGGMAPFAGPEHSIVVGFEDTAAPVVFSEIGRYTSTGNVGVFSITQHPDLIAYWHAIAPYWNTNGKPLADGLPGIMDMMRDRLVGLAVNPADGRRSCVDPDVAAAAAAAAAAGGADKSADPVVASSATVLELVDWAKVLSAGIKRLAQVLELLLSTPPQQDLLSPNRESYEQVGTPSLPSYSDKASAVANEMGLGGTYPLAMLVAQVASAWMISHAQSGAEIEGITFAGRPDSLLDTEPTSKLYHELNALSTLPGNDYPVKLKDHGTGAGELQMSNPLEARATAARDCLAVFVRNLIASYSVEFATTSGTNPALVPDARYSSTSAFGKNPKDDRLQWHWVRHLAGMRREIELFEQPTALINLMNKKPTFHVTDDDPGLADLSPFIDETASDLRVQLSPTALMQRLLPYMDRVTHFYTFQYKLTTASSVYTMSRAGGAPIPPYLFPNGDMRQGVPSGIGFNLPSDPNPAFPWDKNIHPYDSYFVREPLSSHPSDKKAWKEKECTNSYTVGTSAPNARVTSSGMCRLGMLYHWFRGADGTGDVRNLQPGSLSFAANLAKLASLGHGAIKPIPNAADEFTFEPTHGAVGWHEMEHVFANGDPEAALRWRLRDGSTYGYVPDSVDVRKLTQTELTCTMGCWHIGRVVDAHAERSHGRGPLMGQPGNQQQASRLQLDV